MEHLHSWLTLSWLGILFGLFPGYGNAAGIFYEAILVQKKKPAKWLFVAFFMHADYPEGALWARGPRRSRKVAWYISIAYAMLILGGMLFLGGIDFANGNINIIDIVIFNTSFSVLFLLTWLLPVYFLKRYLKKLKPGGEVDRFTFYDHN